MTASRPRSTAATTADPLIHAGARIAYFFVARGGLCARVPVLRGGRSGKGSPAASSGALGVPLAYFVGVPQGGAADVPYGLGGAGVAS